MVSPVSAGGGFTRTGICTIVDMRSLEIEVDVNESYINRVQPDQQVTAILNAYPDWQIPARVITTIPAADRQKATVLVRIGFDASTASGSARTAKAKELDPRILPDMGVKVTFLRNADAASPAATTQAQPVTLVPKAAIKTEGEQAYAFVVAGETVERRAVRIGGTDGDRLEVVAGLRARRSGDRVSAAHAVEWRDGSSEVNNKMASESLVKVRDVHKHFMRGSERVDVLQGVNLDIPQGDFLALMGPSGSGKTTLLNLIGGLDASTGGAVEVGGVNIGRLGGSQLSKWRARNIGFVFQLYNLLPVLTAERNVELPLLLTSLSKSERMKRVGIALKVVGLSERSRHYPRQLSGGQEQRVGIARAIVTDPTLLLCDEPTGDLDRKAGDEILDLLQALNRDHGKTIIMVTHDPRAADRARRTLHLEKGVLVDAEPVAAR